jgi:hypothetical protein
MIIIWITVVLLTFFVPLWMKIILFGINFLLPDIIPFLDEIYQLYLIVKSNNFVKIFTIGKGIKKNLKKFQ